MLKKTCYALQIMLDKKSKGIMRCDDIHRKNQGGMA